MTRQLVDLPLGRVHPHPANQRAGLHDIDQLAASIKQLGLIQPVVVRPHPDKAGEWQLIAGHRRHAAAAKAGQKTITAEVRDDLDDREAVAAMLVENLQRQELTPLEEAAGYRQLVELGWRQKDIAEKTGRSAAVVSKRLKLLDLPDGILPAVRDGRIPLEAGYELARALADRDVAHTNLAGQVTELLADYADGDVHPLEYEHEVLDLVRSATLTARLGRDEAKLAAELEAAGRFPLDGGKQGAKPIEGYAGIDVDYDTHLPEPCSRFKIVHRFHDTTAVEWWCVDPPRHYPDGESTVKVSDDWWQRNRPDRVSTKAEAAWDRDNRIRQARKARRLDLYEKIIGSDPKGWPVTVDLVYQQAILLALHQSMSLTSSDLQLVCDLLGIAYKSSTRTGELRDRVGESFAQDTAKTALAIVMAAGETWSIDTAEKSPARDFAFLLGCDFDDDQQTMDTGDAA